jgi:predicted glycosyltransferase involved in capsule biosynthesis
MKYQNAVLIAHRNRNRYLKLCLDCLSVCNNPGVHQLVLIDQGSDSPPDDLIARIEKTFNVVYLKDNTSGPFHKTRLLNLAAQTSRANYLTVLDNDIMVPPFFLDALAGALQPIPNVGNVAKLSYHVRYLDPERSKIALENSPEWLEQNGFNIKDMPSAYESFEGMNIGNSQHTIERSLFFRTGGFDEKFVGYALEDIDLAVRVHKVIGDTRFLDCEFLHIDHPNDPDWKEPDHCTKNQLRLSTKREEGWPSLPPLTDPAFIKPPLPQRPRPFPILHSLILGYKDRPRFVELWRHSLERQDLANWEIILMDWEALAPPGQMMNKSLCLNMGARKAKGHYFTFCDVDCLMPKGHLSSIERFYDDADNQDARLATPVRYLDQITTQQALKTGDPLAYLERHAFPHPQRYQLHPSVYDGEKVLGNSQFTIRKEQFIDLGGFDDRFVGHGVEDLEFNSRYWEHYGNAVMGTSEVFHLAHGASANWSGGDESNQKLYREIQEQGFPRLKWSNKNAEKNLLAAL